MYYEINQNEIALLLILSLIPYSPNLQKHFPAQTSRAIQYSALKPLLSFSSSSRIPSEIKGNCAKQGCWRDPKVVMPPVQDNFYLLTGYNQAWNPHSTEIKGSCNWGSRLHPFYLVFLCPESATTPLFRRGIAHWQDIDYTWWSTHLSCFHIYCILLR